MNFLPGKRAHRELSFGRHIENQTDVTEKTRPEVNETAGGRQGASLLTSSYAVLAFAMLLLLNLAAIVWYHPDRLASPNRSWAYWAAQDLRNAGEVPDVMFFGSSLMLAVINDADATSQKKSLDAVKHHRSAFFEDALAKETGLPVKTGSLAIGGQMASDSFALFSTLLADRPERPLIVWGIAPRDLVDSSFFNPHDSETVRYLEKVAFPNDVLPERARFWEEAERGGERFFYLYGKRLDVQKMQRDLSEAVLAALVGTRFDTIHTPQKILKMTMGAIPEECSPNQWLVTPYQEKIAGSGEFTDNTQEYLMRYQPFRPKLFDRQSRYLNRFLSEARQRGFETVLVNMPLTADNLRLLPEGVYDRYLSTVKNAAVRHGAHFLDFNASGNFGQKDFCDPVHLHGIAGQKFLRLLAAEISARTQIAVRSGGKTH